MDFFQSNSFSLLIKKVIKEEIFQLKILLLPYLERLFCFVFLVILLTLKQSNLNS